MGRAGVFRKPAEGNQAITACGLGPDPFTGKRLAVLAGNPERRETFRPKFIAMASPDQNGWRWLMC